jgi:hypothetical protein
MTETKPTEQQRAGVMLAFSLLIGNHLMAADHGDRGRAECSRGRDEASSRLRRRSSSSGWMLVRTICKQLEIPPAGG